jgi:transposase
MAVARRHGLHPSLLFRWRREAGEAAVVEKEPAFIPLALPGPASPPAPERAAAGLIEIELAGGHRVRAGAGVDGTVLRGVIEALVQR